MKCKNCGALLEDDTIFCLDCGTRVGNETSDIDIKEVVASFIEKVKTDKKVRIIAIVAALVLALAVYLPSATRSFEHKYN